MVVLITGASSGIGKATAQAFLEKGHKVINISRTPCDLEGIHNISCDITDSEKLKNAFSEIDELDVVVNNAGFGISGAVEFNTKEEIEKQFALNVTAQISVIQNALPLLKKSKGKIINVTSAAAIFPIPFQAFYSATKSAMETITMALANEVKPFGVSVGAVRLGDVKTGFTSARNKNIVGDEEYDGAISRSVAVMEKDEQNGLPPSKIARVIVKLAKKKKLPPIVTVGAQYKFLAFLHRIFPLSFVNFIIRLLYIPKK